MFKIQIRSNANLLERPRINDLYAKLITNYKSYLEPFVIGYLFFENRLNKK